MRRLLIVTSLLILVLVSLATGLLAADWPFWQRAWQWQRSADGWPANLPGAHRDLGAGEGRPLPAGPPADPREVQALRDFATRWPTQALLVARSGALVAEVYDQGVARGTLLEGRALSAAWLTPLFGTLLLDGHAGLLDRPVRSLFDEWADDPRGEITPRQLFWELSGLSSPSWIPLNPFSSRARLASGPNFARAALATVAPYPAGSHFEPSPSNAQLLALVLERSSGLSLADLLESRLWTALGAGRARVLLDRPGGRMAAHCCLAATARDWLRLPMLLVASDHGRDSQAASVLSPGFSIELSRASPVRPGQGMGPQLLTSRSGERLLVFEGQGRLLVAAPANSLAAAWFTNGPMPQQARAELFALLGL